MNYEKISSSLHYQKLLEQLGPVWAPMLVYFAVEMKKQALLEAADADWCGARHSGELRRMAEEE